MKTQDDFGESIRGALFGAAGNNLHYEDWARPFIDEMTGLLIEEGFDESLNYSAEMKAKGYHTGAMAFGEHTPYVIFTIYVTEQIGAWAIGKLCDLVSKGVKKVFSGKGYSGRIKITIENRRGLGIAVDSPAQSDEDADRLKDSLFEVSQRVNKNHQFSKTTNKTLVYTIKEGRLSDDPTIIS